MSSVRTSLLVATALLCAAQAAPADLQAQEYRWETNSQCGVKYPVHTKLSTSPEKFGAGEIYLRAKYRPKDQSGFAYGKWGTANWGLDVYMFKTSSGPNTGADMDEDGVVTEAEKAMAERVFARNWEHFVKEKDRTAQKRKFFQEGKKRKGKGGTPDYTLWEYRDEANALDWYHYAACYKLDGKEVVLCAVLPCVKGKRATSKLTKRAVSMIAKLIPLSQEELALDSDEAKDEFANTPSRKERLQAAKENIADHDDWDYFTTPNFIVIYSYDMKDPAARREQYMTARWLADSSEAIRAKFEEKFPPHDNMRDDYSILRICDTIQRFREYTGAPRGVAGMYRFAEHVKELVVFDFEGMDKEEMLYARAVLFHEAWHQYSDTYFGKEHSMLDLHRWWDEGMAEYFGAFVPKGSKKKQKYGYVLHKGRVREMKMLMEQDRWVPLSSMFKLPQSKFGSAQYAQSFFLMDMLTRGKKKMKKFWQDSWDGIIERYRKRFLETGSGDEANKAAFDGVNIGELEEAWLKWCQLHCR